MEQLWQWSTLKHTEKLTFTSFVITEIVETMDINDSVCSLLLVSLLSFLKKENLIAPVFFSSLHYFELELMKKSKFARLLLVSTSNQFELLCKLYDFIPFADIKSFIHQIRQTHQAQKPQNEEECLHFIKCNYLHPTNTNQLDFLVQKSKLNDNDGLLITTNKNIFIDHLIFDERIVGFYSDEQYVKSFVNNISTTSKEKELIYFRYDVHFVPKNPNVLFLTQLFDSMDRVCIHRKFVPLLLNHLQNVQEDGFLFVQNKIAIGIIAKMFLYKLSPTPKKLESFLEKNALELLKEEDAFILFLVCVALKKPIRFDLLKQFIFRGEFLDSQIECLAFLLFSIH